MKLLTKDIHERLLRNGHRRQQCDADGEADPDFVPVVKLFTPDAGCTWLLTELDPECPDIGFGLCDLGLGFPELGSVSISEIAALRGKLGLPVERDRHFKARHSLSVYAHAAHEAERIVQDLASLDRAAEALRELRTQMAGGAS